MPSLREAEKREDDIYEKLPIFQIEEKYGKTEAGKSLVSVTFPHPSIPLFGGLRPSITFPAQLRAFVERIKASLLPSSLV